jgi:hypothetical protein
MTHTLHRRGNEESLSEDYVVLVMAAQGINDKDAKEKLKKVLEIARKHRVVNIGDMLTGNIYIKGLDVKYMLENIKDSSIIHAVFSNKKDALNYIKELKEADVGLSTVVTGLFKEVFNCCKELHLTPHTVQYSLGIFGRTEILPKEEILWITTMCGHHQISPQLVCKMINDVRKGEKTTEEAGRELARMCVCGVFNPVRAAKIIEKLAKQETV